MGLEVKITKKKDYVYSVELKGPIDSKTYQELEQELNEITNESTKAVILDMSGVDYVSSMGVKVVITAKKSLERKKASFAMVDLQPQVKKVFDMLKILPMFDIFDDAPEADKYIDQIIKDEIKKQST
ncbi:MAG: STAS domain-containing protein [Candidatus Gorgyraea atricola]|nr:STAS domain-containing protein [Candidatus Gorgyraea atricola]